MRARLTEYNFETEIYSGIRDKNSRNVDLFLDSVAQRIQQPATSQYKTSFAYLRTQYNSSHCPDFDVILKQPCRYCRVAPGSTKFVDDNKVRTTTFY